MKKLVIYDAKNSDIYLQMSGSYPTPEELNFLEVDVPDGQMVQNIDISVTPNVANLVDIPKTDIQIANEKLIEQEQEIADMQYALMMGGVI